MILQADKVLQADKDEVDIVCVGEGEERGRRGEQKEGRWKGRRG